MGSKMQRVARVRSTQAFPMVSLLRRAKPRTSAIATAIPVAAERKDWAVIPAIWLK
jgi:hypothetical protein